MEEDAENHLILLANCAVANQIGQSDRSCSRLSELPDSLLCEVLVYFRTKDVVKTSVLSKRWRNLWKFVPRLDLGYGEFPDYEAVVSFVDRFLGFESDSKLREFKLKSESLELKFDGEPEVAHVPRWIDTLVLNRQVEHLKVVERRVPYNKNLKIPSTVYTCESLVTLKLCDVLLPDPSSVSLPRVKTIKLVAVVFASRRTFEMLISGCPVLESLYVERCPYEEVGVFRVRSQSLRSFTLFGHDDYEVEKEAEVPRVVAIDAPKLEYLELFEDQTRLSIMSNLGALVKVDIDTRFNLPYEDRDMLDPNDMPKRKIIRDFLIGISNVRDMIISSDTLEIIYDLSRCEPIPLFRNLSSLRANFYDYRWEMLPVFLESCPNLKSLSLSFRKNPGNQILLGPHRLPPTLEHVKVVKAMKGDVVAFVKLASYFLEKSPILKKFTFCLDDFSEKEEPVILAKLLALPRLSSSCEVVALR
uniref:F-box/LRR-repeat protein 13 n=1 Tax=Noccaea caerulescens TaxID=107243 RepID=A0A1J3IW61_NOCCA